MSFSSGDTPTLSTLLDMAFDRWERQAQTAFPAKVTDFDDTNQVVEVEPAFYEVFRNEDLRVAHALNPIPNVPICYPRGGGFSLYIPPSVGDWVLVLCTKYSLDRWRETAASGDPGDMRRFALDGAVAIPGIDANTPLADGVGNTDTAVFTIPGGQELHLGKKDPDEYIALASKVASELTKIETMLDEIRLDYNAHYHAHGTPNTGPVIKSGGTAVIDANYNKSSVASAKVKAE